MTLIAAIPTVSGKVITDTPPEWKVVRRAAQLDAATVDAALPDYRKIARLEGTVRSVGSSGLSNLLQRWAQEFRSIYPGVEVNIAGGGSDTALPALLEGRADIAPMSRPMRSEEMSAFKAKFGYPPTRLAIAADALAVFVNKYNPLQSASIAQLDRIFSMNHKRGGQAIRNWGELGLGGEWKDRPVVLKGPDRSQGSYALFRDVVLEGGDYRYDLAPEPGSTSVVQAVGAEATAIGFASRFYSTRRTRALAIGKAEGAPAVHPTQENCLNGSYPLSRFLYIYVNRKPQSSLAPATGQLLAFICSKQGQEIVAHENNLPLDATTAKTECTGQLN